MKKTGNGRILLDLTGKKCGYLTITKHLGSESGKSMWEAQCICGKRLKKSGSELTRTQGLDYRSCGCKKSESISKRRKTHGMSYHRAYHIYDSMVQRCTNDNVECWPRYGGRGIDVCEAWYQSFESFWKDMGPTYFDGASLERVDVNEDYCLGNCRWVDPVEQHLNKSTSRFVDTPTGRLNVSVAARHFGINITTLIYRLDNNWPNDKLFIKPDVRNKVMPRRDR